MKIYRGFSDKRLKRRPRAAAIGIFDGVHRGHRKILSTVLREAKRSGSKSMVITFDPHPHKVLHPRSKHPILMSLAHRLRFFRQLGVDETLVVPFNKKFAGIGHEAFLRKWLLGRLGLRFLCTGSDFRFGFKGAGDRIYLKQKARPLGYRFITVRALKQGRETISSTRIRRLIESGDLGKAGRMLGRPVSVYGTVVRGRGRGRSVGFPTANLDPHHETLPPGGVYAAWGDLNGRILKGVLNIGPRPTFGDRQKSLEVHFFHFHKNIYGRELELIFVSRLRATRRFNSRRALAAAIAQDSRRALKLLRRRVVTPSKATR